jgi:hypothetical protein
MQQDPGTKNSARDQTISDFGEQWTRHTENPDYYGSVELFADIIAPFLTLEDIKDSKCADIGSGTGRIVLMMLGPGAPRRWPPSNRVGLTTCWSATPPMPASGYAVSM